MGQSIVQIKQMGDALRSSGYKSIDSAVSEIIDNSIEAEAKDIFVIMREHIDENTGRKCIYEIGILDNGNGMEIDKLASCLGLGYTTKSDRRGMGRFGVGLPQASLHVTPNVEVYSWQSEIKPSDEVYKVWLDINKVKTGEQEVIDDPELCTLPLWMRKYMSYNLHGNSYNFTKSGTFVYWKMCDNIKPKTMAPLTDRLDFTLGRKFRHLIYDGTHNIKIITTGHENEAINVMTNDPLFLMNPNRVLGNSEHAGEISEKKNINCSETLFKPFTTDGCKDGIVSIMVPYLDKDTGEKKQAPVKITFSIVKEEFYDQTAIPVKNPGQTEMGKYVKKMEGISVIRAGREIDFGVFDFFDKTNSPYHRWWGCEISFEPVLDEVFGVSNNKQQVELRDDHLDPSERDLDSDVPIWNQLAACVKDTIKSMVKKNAEVRNGSRSNNDTEISSSQTEKIIGAEEENLNDTEGMSSYERQKITQEEQEKMARDFLQDNGVEDPTIEQIHAIINKDMTIRYKNIGRSGSFIDTDFSMGNIILTVNTAHIFYSEFIEKMSSEAKIAFELFIGALAHAINKTNIENAEENDLLLEEWDYRLKKYLQHIKTN